ncbi:MAG: hypothetical protein WB777_23160 [Mycobacterium sp.]
MSAPLQWFRHVYHSARDYGWPHGLVQPGEVIQAVQPPEPAFFEKVDGPDETVEPAAIPEVEPVVTTDVPPAEVPAVEPTVVTVTDTVAAPEPAAE